MMYKEFEDKEDGPLDNHNQIEMNSLFNNKKELRKTTDYMFKR